MKQYLIITLFTLTVFSCKELNENNFYEGEIYIKLIDIRSLIYNLPDDKMEKFVEGITSSDQSNYSESEKKSSKYFKVLLENDLLTNPFFKLKMESGKIINVYTTITEFQKIEKELNNLEKEKEKISVVFDGYKLSNGIIDSDGVYNQPIFVANQIKSVKKTTGKTDWKK